MSQSARRRSILGAWSPVMSEASERVPELFGVAREKQSSSRLSMVGDSAVYHGRFK